MRCYSRDRASQSLEVIQFINFFASLPASLPRLPRGGQQKMHIRSEKCILRRDFRSETMHFQREVQQGALPGPPLGGGRNPRYTHRIGRTGRAGASGTALGSAELSLWARVEASTSEISFGGPLSAVSIRRLRSSAHLQTASRVASFYSFPVSNPHSRCVCFAARSSQRFGAALRCC